MTSLPLYLDVDQVRVLAVAVGLLLKLDSAMVLGEGPDLAQAEVAFRYGDLARADQVKAAARERLPVLRGLRTDLLALGDALDRAGGDSS